MLHGFHIKHKLYESDQSIVYRAVRASDDRPVVLKLLNSQYPPPHAVARFRQELSLLEAARGPGVIEIHGLERLGHSLVLVLEDFGGESLHRAFDGQPPSLERFLALAIQMAAAVGHIHRCGVIHKDINPSNVVWNRDTGQLKLIDFGIATQLASEAPRKSSGVFEGSLPYMSPEQTGRMNRHLDYRSDFYSLGVALYELLTGSRPFSSRDPLELVHCHLAAQPRPPVELRADVPPVLSEIILKLLAKNAEERYRSAWGLEADLARCQEQLHAGRPSEPFRLAADDVSDRLEIPHKLYGREREREALLERFDRVRAGSRELVLLTGYSGIGKSSLVRELHEPIARSAALLASGKFDLLQRGTPYSAITATFSDLVKQLLAGSADELAQWKARLLDAMGPNGRLLIDVVPALELLVGAQPPVEPSGATEAQHRLGLVFRETLRVFCQPTHPLVLFLDDLQWADPASLHLIESMLGDDSLGCFLFVGAYRDNEVDGAHPLAMLLATLAARDLPLTRIHLEPLAREDVGVLLADTLQTTPEAVAALAEHVLHKTGGNPFFLAAFLRQLHEDGLITFDRERAGWRWSMAEIQAAPATDNVTELLSAELRRLPDEIRQVLRLAACVGNRFDLGTLAIIADRPIPDVYAALAAAIREGLIEPAAAPALVLVGEHEPRLLVREYEFVHDRVQQAAYALIPEHERPAIHLEVGRLLWDGLDQGQRDERLFELVDHLDLGRAVLDGRPGTGEWTPATLAELDLRAARRAREAAAYDAAWRYLETGIELVGEQWDERYELLLALSSEAAEVAGCRADFERSRQMIDTVLARARSPLAKARMYKLAVAQHTSQVEHQEAFRAGRTALALLSQALPEPGELAAAWSQEHARISELIGDRPIASLVDAPAMASEIHEAAVEILGALASTAYQADAALFDVVVARIVRLSLEHGRTRSSTLGYTLYGALLAIKLQDYRRGGDFGALALALAERLGDPAVKCNVGAAMGVVFHWARPLHDFDAIGTDAFRAGLQAGELPNATIVLLNLLSSRFHRGVSLERVRDDARSFLRFSRNSKNAGIAHTLEGFRMAADSLAGVHDPDAGADMAEDAPHIARCQAEARLVALGIYYALKCQVQYILERYQEALEAAEAAERLRPYFRGMLSEAALSFHHALCLLALLPDASPAQADGYRQALATHRQRLATWAEGSPENFRHLELMLEAEAARVAGDGDTAVRCYDEAITRADAGEWQMHLALAHELAARYWLARGRARYAQGHLEDAYYAYSTWGAQRKCALLEEQHPELLVRFKRGRASQTAAVTTASASTSTTMGTGEHLDLASVLKASQAISSEIALDRLLGRLIAVVMENAGAQRGYVVLRHRDALVIEAHGVLDGNDVRVRGARLLAPQGDPDAPDLSLAIVNYVLRTRETVVLHDAAREGAFVRDPQVMAAQARSLLCMPLLHHGQVNGVIYLANHLGPRVFTAERVELLQLLSSQIVISLENARLYHNLHRANQELERLLHGISHDLKEPLRTIHSFSELVMRRYDHVLDSRGRDYLARVGQASERLGQLIEAIRVIAKIRRSTAPRQHTAGTELVRDALLRLAPALSQTQAKVQVAGDLPALMVDRRWATEALYQLLHNALLYTREGHPPEVVVAPYDGSEGVGLVVEDRGIGVPDEDTDRLFDLFRRAVARDVPGGGVGLTIVRQVAVKHDGAAWLRPRQGGGAQAYVTFGR